MKWVNEQYRHFLSRAKEGAEAVELLLGIMTALGASLIK
jgi:hypothetical protein